ncbi:MAG: serine/threonine-protein kinase [Acidimicrobiales bacterium]
MTLINESLGGRYLLVRLLGRGGMSDVYEAVDERSGLIVAVKILRSGDPEFVRRLAHEARALESFEHPGLVRLYETGLARDQAYLVMEFIEGITLAESLRRAPLAARDTAALGVCLADALAYVHERGVVHRDVKPSNIMISVTGDVKLGDFGIAQLHDAATLTITGSMLGTVSYMAPEQLEDTQVGPSADVWSLGIVLLECLTGNRVYEGSPSEIVARRLREPIPLPSNLPVPWKILFGGMLDHRTDERLSGRDVAALLASSPFAAPWVPGAQERDEATYDLTAFASIGDTTVVAGPSRGADATRIDRSPASKRPHRRAPWRPVKTTVGALVTLAAIGIGLGFWLTPSPPRDPTHTTTTTTISSSKALSTLVSDMALAQSAGRMGPTGERSIANSAEQAVANNTSGNSTQAGYNLQQAETAIVNGIQAGTITSAEGAQLLHDLSVLSNALGVAIPPTTTTTSTTSTTTTSTTTTTTTQPGFPGGFIGPGTGDGNGNGN